MVLDNLDKITHKVVENFLYLNLKNAGIKLFESNFMIEIINNKVVKYY